MDIQFNFKTKYELKKFNDYVVMQASHNTDTIKIYCDKIDGGVIYLSFELPKKQKFVTLPLEYDSKKACYQYLLTSAQTQSVGHINFQLTLTLGQQVIKSNKIEGVIEVRESIVMEQCQASRQGFRNFSVICLLIWGGREGGSVSGFPLKQVDYFFA